MYLHFNNIVFARFDIFYFLQAFLMQVGAKECLIRSADLALEAGKLKLVIERSHVLITERKKGR